MAHEIATTNDRPAMAYFGDKPWHGLGTELNSPANANEAMKAGGLDYRVEMRSLYTDGIYVPYRKAVVRTDSNQPLGVVGNRYALVQNSECFEFLDSMVADGELKYHTVGALGKGERVWMLAKLPDEIRVKGSEDVTEQFLLLSNSHDGNSSLRIYFTPIRVVCANTLGVAERRSRGAGVSILHRGDPKSKIEEARQILGLAKSFYSNVSNQIEKLANCYPSKSRLYEYFETLYPDRENQQNRRAENVRKQLVHLFEYGRGQQIPEIRLSMWAAFNAVTEFVDHHRSSRGDSPKTRSSNRLEAAWFGSGARIKAQAWDLAVAIAT